MLPLESREAILVDEWPASGSNLLRSRVNVYELTAAPIAFTEEARTGDWLHDTLVTLTQSINRYAFGGVAAGFLFVRSVNAKWLHGRDAGFLQLTFTLHESLDAKWPEVYATADLAEYVKPLPLIPRKKNGGG